MTENKRFTSKVVDWWHNVDKVRVVFDDGEWIDADNCAKLLNAFYEENELLKKSVKRQQSSNNECAKLIKEQQKEHEQLKLYIEELEFKLRTIEVYNEKLITDKEAEWLRDNTVWEQMPTSKRTVIKTTFGGKNDRKTI